MKKRIAVFKDITDGAEFVSGLDVYVPNQKRISEWVEIDFPAIKEPPEVSEIDRLMRRETVEHQRRMTELNDRRKQWASGEVNYTVKIGEAS